MDPLTTNQAPGPGTTALRTPGRLARVGLVLLALVSFELVARVSWGWPSFVADKRFDHDLGTAPQVDRHYTLLDERGTFEHRLGPEGFRSRALPKEPADGFDPARVLVLGDSYVGAWRVRREERFIEVAEAELDGAVESYCVSCNGWGPQQMLIAYERYAARVGAGRVVIATFPANDVLNASPEFCGTVMASVGDYVRPYLVPRADGTLESWSPHPVRTALRRASVTAARIENALLGHGTIEAFGERSRHDDYGIAHVGALDPTISTDRWERGFVLYADLLAAFVARVRADGAEPLVVVIPNADQVRHGASLAVRDLVAQGASEPLPSLASDFDRPERILAALLTERRIPTVLALDALRAAAPNSTAGLYLDDGHLDSEGHAVVGGLVAAWLRTGATHASIDASLAPFDQLPDGEAAERWADLSRPYHPTVERGLLWTHGTSDGGRLRSEGVRLVLQMDPSVLVVRGRVESHSPLPVELEIFGAGAPLGRLRIDEAGAFHGQVPNPGAALVGAVPRAHRPYVPIDVRAVGGKGALVLSSIGFEDAAPKGTAPGRAATYLAIESYLTIEAPDAPPIPPPAR